ncbi:hypothetical protein BKI52_17090 [marine bacterium AO1-C]|nr:hypothetical protein BKI52_17090 [marine bacterium AO1-C]
MRVKLIVGFILLLVSQAFTQSPDKAYKKIKLLVTQAVDIEQLKDSLNTFKAIQFPYNRRLYRKYRHFRVYLYSKYQIDVLSYKNQVIFRSIKFIKDSSVHFSHIDTLAIQQFISEWNNFYVSHKTIDDFQQEITLQTGFTLRTGFDSPTLFTKKLKEWVIQEKVDTLKALLQSFYVEQQTFGAVGIRQLRKKGAKLPKKLRQLARYIRRRNAEILTFENSCVAEVRPYF